MGADEHTRAYLRNLLPAEDEALQAARARSDEAGIPGIPPETGALLRWLARLRPARDVAEIGSGGGYSGLWLLEGMHPRGVLTTIELDPDHQAMAQRAYTDARVHSRVRSILGAALSVLPKLADDGYDLVFIDAVKSEYPDYLTHARRMLRPGGLLVADNALFHGRVPDPAVDDADVNGIRAFTEQVYDDPGFDAQVLEVGDGVLVAVHHPGGD